MLIGQHLNTVTTDNVEYVVHICGQERVDGTWEGWIEFRPSDSRHPVLTTEQETSQPNRTALKYWADGLEPIYLEGAFARAQAVALVLKGSKRRIAENVFFVCNCLL